MGQATVTEDLRGLGRFSDYATVESGAREWANRTGTAIHPDGKLHFRIAVIKTHELDKIAQGLTPRTFLGKYLEYPLRDRYRALGEKMRWENSGSTGGTKPLGRPGPGTPRRYLGDSEAHFSGQRPPNVKTLADIFEWRGVDLVIKDTYLATHGAESLLRLRGMTPAGLEDILARSLQTLPPKAAAELARVGNFLKPGARAALERAARKAGGVDDSSTTSPSGIIIRG